MTPRESAAYAAVIQRVAGMVNDPRVQDFARVRGLDVLDVTWEDTGRYDGSAVGPNISDMTIQVMRRIYKKDGTSRRTEMSLMPVIRFPNFADKTGDVPIDRLSLLVGNEHGKPLRAVSLKTYLGDLRRFLSKPESWAGEGRSLLADRDTHVLVSAQAAFLPIPKAGEATFNPVLFNYQSGKKNPAVLAIVATREGTSATIIDNARDGFDADGLWGQRLFFNHAGEKASFTGQRLSDTKPEEVGTASVALGDESGLNMVMLIQVPLEHRARGGFGVGMAMMGTGSGGGGFGDAGGIGHGSDVEAAVIGHGALEGPFVEVDGLPIERDPRFPIRVTVQFYKATSNGVVSRRDMVQIQEQIKRVLKDADYVGSLVVDGRTGRPTDWDGDHTEPPLELWWGHFWRHFASERGWPSTPALWGWPWFAPAGAGK